MRGRGPLLLVAAVRHLIFCAGLRLYNRGSSDGVISSLLTSVDLHESPSVQPILL
jgi:hypothetical protein